MTIEKLKAQDIVASGLTANTQSGEAASAKGRFAIECHDKDGNLKWSAAENNLVVNVGLQYLAGSALDAVTPITSWYIGLYGAGASNTPAASDTLASHVGWTDITPYSGSRPLANFATATTANPSVVTNSANKAQFTINATATVGGAFLCSVASGTSGTLFSAADFSSPGDRSVVSGDVLSVTYTFSLSA
jgi:hypothetical protein